ncbi:hypothetical protein OP10G_2786 [Fimbriimonas ginsengisoli Gsoil 348]|uniref:Uncharacterized protein n=1 Tax=Fimbriimonas ginsengisoli Gsoil 348 TaxID=661478 RepID=A0A068NX18_FIMGI|nr:hypothetical protein OP10G_2786 [Fimbriimonas ginsengisoli Gsoil 348]
MPDTNITPADTLAIIPINTGFLGAVPAGSQLIVNGTANSGAFVNTNGLLAQSVGLPVTEAGTDYTLEFPDADLNTNRVLTVHHTIFSGKFYLQLNPLRIISPVPVDLVGRIPNNGQNAAGSVVTALFGPGNNGRSARLFIDYGNGFALDKTVTIANNRAVFANIQHDNSNVPVTGVETLAFIIGDL